MDLDSLVTATWHGYNAFQQAHPLIGSMITAEGTFVLGDIVVQKMFDGRLNPKKLAYTAKLAPAYGAMIYGLMQTGELPAHFGLDSPLEKAALGPNLWGHLLNAFFFVNNTVGEKTSYAVQTLGEFYRNSTTYQGAPALGKIEAMKNIAKNIVDNIPGREFLITVAFTETAWNAFQTANFAYVPEAYRSPAALAFSVPAIAFLTYLSTKGARKTTNAHITGE